MFEKITDSIKSAVSKIRHFDDEKSLKRVLDDLRKALLKSDVHHKVTKDLLTKVEQKTKQQEIGKASFAKALEESLFETLAAAGSQGFVFAPKPPTVVIMAGLQGSGKTTTTAKLANYLKQRNKKVLLAAADLERVAAVDQLKQLAIQAQVDIHTGSNPIDVAKESLKKAKDSLYDVLIIDTAGRLAIDEKLMEELKAIKKAVDPDEIFYVADSMTGQDAVKTAISFNEAMELTGVILTKFDGDSTGGVAIGLASQVGVPLRFIGTGEKLADLELFVPDRIVSRLMGEGDMAGLAEKVSTVIDEKKAKDIQKKIKKGAFNFNDFLEQIETVSKLGNMKSLLSMIPGAGQLTKQLGDIDLENSREIVAIRAMINSMTKKERENPDLINGSRRERIAKGSGVSVAEINRVLKQFKGAAKMAKQFSSKQGLAQLSALMGQQGLANLKR